jgi:hypothetical protein
MFCVKEGGALCSFRAQKWPYVDIDLYVEVCSHGIMFYNAVV